MSLINDALKKVQRQHGGEPAAPLPVVPGGPAPHPAPVYHVHRRGTPPAAQMFVLIGAGAAVLIVLSVIVTVVLINRSPAPAHAPTVTTAPVTAKPLADLNAPSPVIVAPVISLPSKLADKGSDADPISAATAEPTVTAAPIPLPAIAPPPNPQILTFVDAIHVTGIRSSGNESKVLMNDRVYRVNDMVDRLLGLKLIKVESDLLTFTDEKGVIYTKSF